MRHYLQLVAFSFPDGLYLLNKYTTFYQEMLAGTQVAAVQITNMSPDRVEKLLAKARKRGAEIFVAVYKDTLVHIVAGHVAAIEKVRSLIAEYDDAKIQDIGIEVGLHSVLMNEVTNQLQLNLEKVDCKELVVPCASGITGALLSTPEQVKEQIVSNVNQPVHWTRTLALLADYDLIIEIGPGTALTELVKTHYPTKQVMAVNKQADIDELKKLVAPTAEELPNG